MVEAVRNEWQGLISIDTTKAAVARAALLAGADIVNDISGLRADAAMVEVCRGSKCGIVVMHMQGEPRTMQESPSYRDVVVEVRHYFEERFRALTAAGIEAERL